MSAQHTPGPWFMDSEGTVKRAIRDEDGNHTGYELLDGDSSFAPALLAALENMLDQSHLCGHDCDANKPCPRGEAARAAIKQARGEA